MFSRRRLRPLAPGQPIRVDDVSITAYPNGPYLVRGPVRLFDGEGEEVDLRRRTIAVCRCGRARIYPLCDGTHKAVGFRADGGVIAGSEGPGSRRQRRGGSGRLRGLAAWTSS